MGEYPRYIPTYITYICVFPLIFPFCSSILIGDLCPGTTKVSNLGGQFWHHEGVGIPLRVHQSPKRNPKEIRKMYQSIKFGAVSWSCFICSLFFFLQVSTKRQEVLCESDHILHQQRIAALQLPLLNQVRLGLHTTCGPTKRSL